MTAFSAGQVSFIGKTPSQAEFLPVPSGVPGFSAFDTWLTEATEWAAGRAGPEWPEAFAAGTIHAFVFRPSSSEPDLLVCGALAPSRDRAGRQFPLAAAAALRVSKALTASPHLIPFALEGFWAGATELLLSVVGRSDVDPSAASAGLSAEPVIDEAEAHDLYERWASDIELGELWSLLGPPLDGPEPSAPLRLLAETVAPFVGTERPETMLSMRLPLGLAGGAAVCFWLDLLTRSMRWRSTIPSFFWSHDGQRGETVLHLGRPPKMTLAELWMPSGRHDQICDLTVAPARALLDALPAMSPELASLLSTPGAKVAELLQHL